MKIQTNAIAQAQALVHRVQAVQLTESDSEDEDGGGKGLSKSQKKRLRKKLRDATVGN